MAEYIEREKLAEALKIWQNTLIEAYGEDDEYVRCLNSVLLRVDNAPAADARKNKRGRWEYSFHDEDGLEIVECVCSACHDYKESYAKWLYDNGNRNWFNFCPNCGADMREEQT